jgi:hypothetical protein
VREVCMCVCEREEGWMRGVSDMRAKEERNIGNKKSREARAIYIALWSIVSYRIG